MALGQEMRLSPRRQGLVLATALLVTVPLIYLGVRPIRLAQINLSPNSERLVEILDKEIATRVSCSGPAYFSFRARVVDPLVGEVRLKIRPDGNREFFQQQPYPVQGGIANGVAQLGSDEDPVRHGRFYDFELEDARGRLILDGRIILAVHAIAGGPTWVMISLGVLASVLQIAAAIGSRR